jgi:O-antigen ligase
MPEHLRAFVVIMVLSTVTFALIKPIVIKYGMDAGDFDRRRNAWFVVTASLFLSHSFWLFIGVCAITVYTSSKTEKNPVSLYAFLVFAAPAVSSPITGLGLVNQLFEMDYLRLLSLILLLPIGLNLSKFSRSNYPFIARSWNETDVFLLLYLGVLILLNLSVNTFTNTIRVAVLYPFLDIFLPYYVARIVSANTENLRDVLLSFLSAASVLASCLVFEFVRQWSLYPPLAEALSVNWGNWDLTAYLFRDDRLRAQGTTGHPINAGFVMIPAIVLAILYAAQSRIAKTSGLLVMCLVCCGSVAAMSRGPWLSAAIGIVIFATFSPTARKLVAGVGLLAGAGVGAVIVLGDASQILKYLPFFGDVDFENIEYRQRLLEVGFVVIQKNPFFGAYDYIYSSAVQELKQGQGIIDIVNFYLGVALSSGLVGLSFIVAFFLSPLIRLGSRVMKATRRKVTFDGTQWALIAIGVSCMVMLGTTSIGGVLYSTIFMFFGLIRGASENSLIRLQPMLQIRLA